MLKGIFLLFVATVVYTQRCNNLFNYPIFSGLCTCLVCVIGLCAVTFTCVVSYKLVLAACTRWIGGIRLLHSTE